MKHNDKMQKCIDLGDEKSEISPVAKKRPAEVLKFLYVLEITVNFDCQMYPSLFKTKLEDKNSQF